MTEVRLDHVSVTAADLERSIAFYRDVLGLSLVDRGELEGEELETLIDRPGARARWAELALGGG
ncbi:MAG: VOC family protein, partial [Actinomycetota bacterium]